MAVISEYTFDPLRRYIDVRLQQGVPIVDVDQNLHGDMRRFEVRAFLKWFVGDGVPEGTDGFRIEGTGGENDFRIRAGLGPGPADGLANVGRCLVDGLDVIIAADCEFTDQPLALHAGQAGSAALAAALGVPQVAALEEPAADETALVFLDVWERLVTAAEDPELILSGLGVESCARIKREWVVRVKTGTTLPVAGDPQFTPGHRYYRLASIARRNGDSTVNPSDVTDLREQRLLLPPATLVEDLFGPGVTTTAYRQGRGRPVISLRSAINALLKDELPSTPDAPIAPDPASDIHSQSFLFDPANRVNAVWPSNRVNDVLQVFATRWDSADPDLTVPARTTPQQLTTEPGEHGLPQAVVLPGGELLVVYETERTDVHFKRASFENLASAAEEPVAASGEMERHPSVVRAGTRVVFFWWQGGQSPRWMVRVREYTPAFTEADATWGQPMELSPTDAWLPGRRRGGFFATVDDAGEVWAAFVLGTGRDGIQAVRFNPVTSAKSQPAAFIVPGTTSNSRPFVFADGNLAVWVVWVADNQIVYQRFRKDLTPPDWEASSTLVPGTGGSNDAPAGLRDASGAVWLFWVHAGEGRADILTARNNPVTGGWGEPRQVTGSTGGERDPFPVLAPDGKLWLFWSSGRAGALSDLYFKQLITSL
jgi:hypothetical protein